MGKLCKYCARLKLHVEEQFANFPKVQEGVWDVEPACRIHRYSPKA